MRHLFQVIMDSTNLVARIKSNNSLISNKLRSLQTLLDHAPEQVRNNVEKEKTALRLENDNIRKEIEQLVGKLSDLEQAAGIAQVESAKPCVINTQVTKPVQPSVSVAAPVAAPASSQASAPEAKGKKEKKKADKAAPSAAATAPAAGDERVDVSRLDLRIGKIVAVRKHPDADSLYVEEVDVGEGKNRTVVSGLVKFVPIEEMQDRMAMLLCNLKPAKMRGVTSEAMVMCASTPEKVEIMQPPEGAVPGDRVVTEGYPGEPDAQLNPKKKIWESVAPDLKTNDKLEATYKGAILTVPGKGAVKAPSLANVQVK
ncbi:Aminoacyl tRNA synthase complex-interacting multifunctional protein 1 [Halotydeus destructor]|nr:Aminoacyl tRNA synthase complex-interacting multifunctional protein 1 [Halotydeus destructor]